LASNDADQDPFDLAFLRAAREQSLLGDGANVLAFTPFSPSLRRTQAVIERQGKQFNVVKGALRTVAVAVGLDATSIAALEAEAEGEAEGEARKGFRVLAVALGESGSSLALVGLCYFYDAPRPDSRLLIAELNSLGVSVKMLTGDALPVAREVALELGLGQIARAPELRAAQEGK
jgi:H+-transporting ATPase